MFTVANEEGKPLQYEVDGKPMAIFYADVAAAKKQFDAASANHPECDIVPVGLGAAYALSCSGKASLVPGMTELTAAGMPEGLPALGQELPLFACMEMTKELEDGATVIPLFMSFDDCEAAVKEARKAFDRPELQMTALSLPSVVEHLSSIADGTQAFDFMPPAKSTDHISRYVGKGVYARVVEEE